MRARGCTVDLRDVLVLTGSTQGITLVAQSLAEPGDEIVSRRDLSGALPDLQIAGAAREPRFPLTKTGCGPIHVEAILRHAPAASSTRGRQIQTRPA